MPIRIKPQQAALGMYVQGFDGNWLSHPFWRAQFVIRSEADLLRVRNGGTDIFIDPAKGTAPAPTPTDTTPLPADKPLSHGKAAWIERATLPLTPAIRSKRRPKRIAAVPAFGKADESRAAALAQRSTAVVKALFDDVRLGRSIQTPQILEVVRDIADTLERTGTAFASVTRLKTKDDYTYTHSVAVCALMVSLAREVGATPDVVRDMGVAGLLHDVGKLHIDEAILRKEDGLTIDERRQIARHPELGHALLSAETGVPTAALDVCLHHHERLDGSGYPFGLRDADITPAVRMAAICDVYDAMTSNRPYRKGMSPVAAITEMAKMEGHFDQDLLFRFMRSIGVFPAGKLMRLRSNRLAIVMPTPRPDYRPTVRAFYDTVGTHFIEYQDAVLSDRLTDEQAVSQEDPAVWFSTDWIELSSRITAGALALER